VSLNDPTLNANGRKEDQQTFKPSHCGPLDKRGPLPTALEPCMWDKSILKKKGRGDKNGLHLEKGNAWGVKNGVYNVPSPMTGGGEREKLYPWEKDPLKDGLQYRSAWRQRTVYPGSSCIGCPRRGLTGIKHLIDSGEERTIHLPDSGGIPLKAYASSGPQFLNVGGGEGRRVIKKRVLESERGRPASTSVKGLTQSRATTSTT